MEPSVKKVKYEKPTAVNQRKQIADNSKFIGQLRRDYSVYVVITDYELQIFFAPWVATLWTNIPLTNIEFWTPVVRSSVEVQNSMMTTVVNMKLSIRYDIFSIVSSPSSIFFLSPLYFPLPSPSIFLRGHFLFLLLVIIFFLVLFPFLHQV